MKLSVVVPVYNTAEYLDECIRSIIHQTYKDIEVILVDDGSMMVRGQYAIIMRQTLIILK